jgi:hypothetical protein
VLYTFLLCFNSVIIDVMFNNFLPNKEPKMSDNQAIDRKPVNLYKKWHQLKQKQQIIVSTILRDTYIMFVLENKRKPSKSEKQSIIGKVFLELQEKEIFIADNELYKYFESKISNYDKSIEKSGLMS